MSNSAPLKTAIRSYRDLRVWQQSMDLAETTYTVTKSFPDTERYGLVKPVAASCRLGRFEHCGGSCTVIGRLSTASACLEWLARRNGNTVHTEPKAWVSRRGWGRVLTAIVWPTGADAGSAPQEPAGSSFPNPEPL